MTDNTEFSKFVRGEGEYTPERKAKIMGEVIDGAIARQNAPCANQVAAEAYQVIGAIAGTAGLFDNSEVQRALDYFGDIASDGKATRNGGRDILPWAVENGQ